MLKKEYLQEHIKTYADFAKELGNMILCNDIVKDELELVNGSYYDEEYGDCYEIFQYYIIQDPRFAMRYTDEIIFYDNRLNLYVLGVTHYGTAWSYVPAPEFK